MASPMAPVGAALKSLRQAADPVLAALRSNGLSLEAKEIARLISEVQASGLKNRPALQDLHKICKQLRATTISDAPWVKTLETFQAAVATLLSARP